MTLFQGDHDKKAELIKRAVEHREADRLIQQYGFFEPMDEAEAEHYNRPEYDGEKSDWREGDWAGCAIGCLATEVLSQEEYRNLWKQGELSTVTYEDAVSILQDDFGIPQTLTTMAEFCFEALPKEEAKRWPEQFARALPVGGFLDDQDCRAFMDQESNRWIASDSIRMSHEDHAPLEARDTLLDWLSDLPVSSPA